MDTQAKVPRMNPVIKAVVLFSGVGGSSLGLKQAGVKETIGVEWDPQIGEAAQANGIQTCIGDVRAVDPYELVREFLGHAWGPFPRKISADREAILLLQASPSCQSFSAAGKQAGKSDLPLLTELLREYGALAPMARREESVIDEFRRRIDEGAHDERSAMSLEPIFWIAQLRPELISFEQVPAVLPLWEVYAEVLREWGYSVWTANLTAEQYGVPQTRKRAYLGASNIGEATPPAPSHSRYYPRTPEKLDDGLPKWISMAEALTQGLTEQSSYTVTGGGAATGGAEPYANGARKGMKKAQDEGKWAVKSGQRSHGVVGNEPVRQADEPSLTVMSTTNRWKVEVAS